MAANSSMNAIRASTVLVIVLIVLFADVNHSEALRYKEVSMRNKRIVSILLLKELEYHGVRVKRISRRMAVTESAADRVSPGGPDPEHH
ncbi:unnamed protein product [Linum trigynum]|uniref:Uncharacterized protein n=1 Tax=Linum trigynum TaxID=586398 RepID=A0AAV2ER32_9ROSI